MAKIGRNELCPCGSGKKYKKCCIDKPEPKFRQRESLWTYEEVYQMDTAEIVEKLESFGIHFDKEVFLQDIQQFYSAEQLSENWFKKFRVTAKGFDEDFPWFAAWILWERLAPSYILSMEQMDDLIEAGVDLISKNKPGMACDVWLKVWDALKYRFKPEYTKLEYYDEQYKGSFFVSNFCQDLENELQNAGLEDKSYFEKRIAYCREFLRYFPDEEELIVHNTRRAIAESYAGLGNYEQAELECKKLVQDYPANPWAYVTWGDMYFDREDYAKAKEIYEQGLAIAKDKEDQITLQERLEDLEKQG